MGKRNAQVGTPPASEGLQLQRWVQTQKLKQEHGSLLWRDRMGKGKSGNLWSLLELSMVATEEGTFWERAI